MQEEQKRTIFIKVIGVGGAGGNAVNHMKNNKIKDVDFVVCNTDRQALMSSPVETKIQLGAELLEGLGAGTDWEMGRLAAEESQDYINRLMEPPTKMVFITAGMGGGTGTGAAPVVAKAAREKNMLTVAVVTEPSFREGTLKVGQAAEGIALLKQYCDTVLVISNDMLRKLHGKLPVQRAFEHADNVLANAVKSIAEIITKEGAVNADFKDVEKILKNAGTSVMSSAVATGPKGEGRAIEAIEAALNSPLLKNNEIKGAKRILVTLTSSNLEEYQATLDEETDVEDHVIDYTGGKHELLKVAHVFEEGRGEELQVTIIAAGFEDGESLLKKTKESATEEIKLKRFTDVNTDKNKTEEIGSERLAPKIVVEGSTVTTSSQLAGGVKIIVNQPVDTPSIQNIPKPTDKIPVPKVPKEDPALINRINSYIAQNRIEPDDYERIPAYQRQGIVLLEKPVLAETQFIYATLDNIKR